MALEIFEATVVRIEDEFEGAGLRGAIFVQCDQILEDVEYPDPVLPLFPHNWFDVPEVEDIVEIEIDLEDEKPIPRWRNVVYHLENDIPREMKVNYTKRRGIKTKGGHLLLFDDNTDTLLLKLEHTFGHMIEMLDSGITIKGRQATVRNEEDETADEFAPEFQRIFFDTVNKKIIIDDHHLNSVTLDETGIVILDVNLNKIEMTATGTKITEKDGAILNLSSGDVAIGKEHELLDLFDQTLAEVISTEIAIQALTVPTAVGPSGVPINSADFANIQTALNTIKTNLGLIKGSL